MPGIARNRRQPRSWSAPCRSIRPRATSRAARTSASAREPARSKRLQQRRRGPGERRRRRQVAQVARPTRRRRPAPAQAAAEPHARSIAAARSYSISCSQIAHASASKGSGRRVTRSHGRVRSERPISGSRAKRAAEGAQISSTPERESHPRDARSAAARGVARARPNSTLSAAGCATRTSTGPRRRAAAVQAPRRAGASGRPCRCARGSRNGSAGRTSTRSSTRSLSGSGPVAAPSRCTSTSSERLPTICSSSPAPARRRSARRGPGAWRRGPSRAPPLPPAPVHEPDDRRTRHEAARRPPPRPGPPAPTIAAPRARERGSRRLRRPQRRRRAPAARDHRRLACVARSPRMAVYVPRCAAQLIPGSARRRRVRRRARRGRARRRGSASPPPAHRFHAAVHRRVRLEDPAHLAAVLRAARGGVEMF